MLTDHNSDTQKDGEKIVTTIGPFWQWLKAREGAITALSTLFLMFFTAALVFATILLFRSGERSVEVTRKVAQASKEAADAAIIAQRPWVSLKAKIGPRDFFYDANGANLDLIFLLNNTGNTPAISVRIEGRPRIDVKTNDILAELENVCAKAKTEKTDPKMVGYTIFPKDVLTLPMTYAFSGKEELDKISLAQHGLINPIVIGCVDYFLTFGEPVHHQSRFVYTALHTSGAIRIADGDREANTLSLAPSLEAGSFQAD